MIKIGKLNISKKNLIIISVVIFIVIGGIFLLSAFYGPIPKSFLPFYLTGYMI